MVIDYPLQHQTHSYPAALYIWRNATIGTVSSRQGRGLGLNSGTVNYIHATTVLCSSLFQYDCATCLTKSYLGWLHGEGLWL